MKKHLAILLALVMVVSLVACGSEDTPSESQPSVSTQEPANTPAEGENNAATPSENNEPQDGSDAETPTSEVDAEQGSNILVAYFSRVGNTQWADGVDAVSSASLNVVDGEFAGNAQLLAQMAQETTGGDLFFIETVEKYPAGYRATTDLASDEKAADTRLELAAHVDNMDSYDTIVLIYPNWWGGLSQAVKTFLEEYDFSGKILYPLCTHEGSGLSNTARDIEELCPGVTVSEGLGAGAPQTPRRK